MKPSLKAVRLVSVALLLFFCFFVNTSFGEDKNPEQKLSQEELILGKIDDLQKKRMLPKRST